MDRRESAQALADGSAVLLMLAIAYYLLEVAILHNEGNRSLLARALGSNIKGKISPFLYLSAIGLAFVSPAVAIAIDVFVAIMWLVPDRGIEKTVGKE
jgi:uncharacterized membrane protein